MKLWMMILNSILIMLSCSEKQHNAFKRDVNSYVKKSFMPSDACLGFDKMLPFIKKKTNLNLIKKTGEVYITYGDDVMFSPSINISCLRYNGYDESPLSILKEWGLKILLKEPSFTNYDISEFQSKKGSGFEVKAFKDDIEVYGKVFKLEDDLILIFLLIDYDNLDQKELYNDLIKSFLEQ